MRHAVVVAVTEVPVLVPVFLYAVLKVIQLLAESTAVTTIFYRYFSILNYQFQLNDKIKTWQSIFLSS